MTHHTGSWSSYTGSGSLILAIVLLIVTGVLLYCALRLHHPITVKRPGKFVGISIVALWVLSATMFVVAVIVYVLALYQQFGHLSAPTNPITPVTFLSGIVTFLVIAFTSRASGFWIAVGSAIVGTIAAPLIFELPFNLIVMWRTYPPHPGVLFTLLFFLPLFLVEILSFVMLSLSPLMRLTRMSLFLLASMFLIFAAWAVFGFAYPAAPIPIAMNVISKLLSFATAISLFVPQEGLSKLLAEEAGEKEAVLL
jgi:hypothetical protein